MWLLQLPQCCSIVAQLHNQIASSMRTLFDFLFLTEPGVKRMIFGESISKKANYAFGIR